MICSFRAECLSDDYDLLSRINNRVSRISIFPDLTYPDVEVELEGDLTTSLILRELAHIDDGHVMIETFRRVPRIRNDMTRG